MEKKIFSRGFIIPSFPIFASEKKPRIKFHFASTTSNERWKDQADLKEKKNSNNVRIRCATFFIKFSSAKMENVLDMDGKSEEDCRNLITHGGLKFLGLIVRVSIFHMSQQIFGIFCYFIRRYFHPRLNYEDFSRAIMDSKLFLVRVKSFNGFSNVNICDF